MNGPTEASSQIARRALFGTPLAVTVMPEFETLNRQLEAEILPLYRAAGPHQPTAAWHSAPGTPTLEGAAMTELLEAACLLIAEMTGQLGDENPKRWHAVPRAHVLSRGQSIEVHSHPGVAWEASYLIAAAVDGAAGPTSGPGGGLEFQDPRGAAPVMYAPNLTFMMPDSETLGVSKTMAAKPGVLAVYPAWLMHAVGFYRGDEPRISATLHLTPRAGRSPT